MTDAMTTVWAGPDGRSLLHRASARAKVVALVAFAAVVVATPREWFIAFAIYGAGVISLLVIARVPPGTVVRRMLIEVPFVIFALVLPFVATGPSVQIGPLSLSVAGLWGAWGLLVKAALVILAVVVLVSTTDPRRIVLALGSLRLPHQLTSIMGFMLRYLDLIVGETARMRTARESRGFTARGPRSWRVLAQGVGVLFVRSHARGERVHLAMLSRGFEEPGRP